MKISIGSDHRGYQAKQRVKALLLERGAKLVDHGTDSCESCDYPDIGFAVAQDVAVGQAERGILFCGSGIGMSITANKVPGVRAALCLPADLVGDALMQSIVKVWLDTAFEGGRHARRVEKIVAYEQDHSPGGSTKARAVVKAPRRR
jgi:ribose 5-phosphate isomerase B